MKEALKDLGFTFNGKTWWFRSFVGELNMSYNPKGHMVTIQNNYQTVPLGSFDTPETLISLFNSIESGGEL